MMRTMREACNPKPSTNGVRLLDNYSFNSTNSISVSKLNKISYTEDAQTRKRALRGKLSERITFDVGSKVPFSDNTEVTQILTSLAVNLYKRLQLVQQNRVHTWIFL
jgi:hypothetical protein